MENAEEMRSKNNVCDVTHAFLSLIFKTVVSLEKGPDEVGSYQTLSSYFVLLFHRDSESKHIPLA
jgi:hypothetical protein